MEVKPKTCKALVLSGGAVNGAWEAGVLWGLTHYGDETDYRYDVVTGVSAGAINGAALSFWPVGQEKDATEYISDVWKNLTNDSIYESGPAHWISAFWTTSVYDTEPGKKFLKEIFDSFGSFKRKFSISAVDVNNGEIYTATESTVPFDEFHIAVLGSASVPGIFPPMEFDGHLLMDGGTVYNTNVEEAVRRC